MTGRSKAATTAYTEASAAKGGSKKPASGSRIKAAPRAKRLSSTPPPARQGGASAQPSAAPANDTPLDGAGQLHALVTALLAFVATWRSKLTAATPLLVLRAIEAVLGQVAALADAPDHRARLVVRTAGATAGLSLVSTDPGEDTCPARRGVDDHLADLMDDLGVVLDHHDTAVIRSPGAMTLFAALADLHAIASDHLDEPGTSLEHVEHEGSRGGLRLASDGRSAPATLAPQHSTLLLVAGELLDQLAQVGDNFTELRVAIENQLDADSSYSPEEKLEDLRDALARLDRSLWFHGERAVDLGRYLTGYRPGSLGRVALSHRIDEVLRGRVTDPFDSYRNRVVREAVEAFDKLGGRS